MKFLLAICTVFISIFCFSQSLNYIQPIEGKWISDDGKIIVEIFKNGNAYRGKVVWFSDGGNKNDPMALRTDKYNPNPSLRQRKLLGMEVLTGLTYNSDDGDWQNGKIYDALSGKTWSASASLASNGDLNVRGFWHFEFLGKTMTFLRYNQKIL